MLNKSALIIDIISCLRNIRTLANVAVVAIMLSASQETHVAVRNAMRIGINPILCLGRPNQRSRIGSSSRASDRLQNIHKGSHQSWLDRCRYRHPWRNCRLSSPRNALSSPWTFRPALIPINHPLHQYYFNFIRIKHYQLFLVKYFVSIELR
jgi:hypothetical protein